ncbi:hypothetical protein HPB49_023437 [Dermacentor silvarum]|uniref:Uncharacterized protein n=1 Tax=Dermacentor silvarum TaxID=543639 RepID=A0ACB8D0G4_DERSI|nr:hypothetical protein HPB49_023437 [Dermacentor silvarum]
MTAAATEGLEPFDIAHPEEWEDYAERFQFFLEAQGVTDASRCGPATFQLARALVAPEKTPWNAWLVRTRPCRLPLSRQFKCVFCPVWCLFYVKSDS